MRSISRRTGVVVIVAMVAAVMLLSMPGRERWREVLQDAGHGPVFAIIAVALALMAVPSASGGARSSWILARSWLVAVLLGMATEAGQHFLPGRSVSAMDVLHDAAGAALGLGVLALIEGPLGLSRRIGAAVVVSAAVLVLAWSPVQCALAYAHRAEVFPTLASAGDDRDLYFVRCVRCSLERAPLPRAAAGAGESSLRVSYARQDRPRFEIFEPAADWRGFRNLGVDVYNPDAGPLFLVLKIQDAEHDLTTRDRLNLRLRLAPGERRRIVVPMSVIETAPATRRMDLARMANVALYTQGPARDGTFYVSRIWLE